MDFFAVFGLFVDQPWLAFIPAAAFAIAGLFGLGRAAWAAAAAWGLYALYELAVWTRLICSGECNIRVDLLVIVPLLLVASIAGLFGIARSLAGMRNDGANPSD